MSQILFHIIFISIFIAIYIVRTYYYSQVKVSGKEVDYDKSDWQPRVRRYLGRPYGLIFFLYLVWPRLFGFAQADKKFADCRSFSAFIANNRRYPRNEGRDKDGGNLWPSVYYLYGEHWAIFAKSKIGVATQPNFISSATA